MIDNPLAWPLFRQDLRSEGKNSFLLLAIEIVACYVRNSSFIRDTNAGFVFISCLPFRSKPFSFARESRLECTDPMTTAHSSAEAITMTIAETSLPEAMGMTTGDVVAEARRVLPAEVAMITTAEVDTTMTEEADTIVVVAEDMATVTVDSTEEAAAVTTTTEEVVVSIDSIAAAAAEEDTTTMIAEAAAEEDTTTMIAAAAAEEDMTTMIAVAVAVDSIPSEEVAVVVALTETHPALPVVALPVVVLDPDCSSNRGRLRYQRNRNQ